MKNIKDDIVFTQKLRGFDLTFHSTWGLFSPKKIDEGTELLINNVNPEKDNKILDIGCGYGAIGITLAKIVSQGEVHLIDKDFVAVEYTTKNARINNLNNCKVYLSNGFSNVPDIKFDLIVSNIPAKVGKELYQIIISDVKKYLKPGGKLYFVYISGLKEYFKRTFKEVLRNYTNVANSKTYTVGLAINE